MNGEDFYRTFYCEFYNFANSDKRRYESTDTDPKWTCYIKDEFLTTLGKKLGFCIGTKNIFAVDLTWEDSKGTVHVAIEHENNHPGVWKDEVPNLLRTDAPLKVLITYISEAEFPATEFSQRLLAELKKRDFNREFLLILGSYSMNEPTDWVAYLYQKTLSVQTLSACSNLLEIENKPAQKAWKTRKAPK